MTNDVSTRSISELGPQIERREISPVELLAAVLHDIARLDGELNSYITVLADDARAAARAAESRIADGDYRGPLDGIPIAIKDSIAVSGAPTTNGSRLWVDHVPDFDAAVVTRLREAGAIILGKNSMHEWGMGGTCTGMHFGTVRNPWDPTRVPGGSSGGSAAAVAAGLAGAAIGADGWGSIRTPASYCGVVGLMPTPGLVSRFGELPPTSSWHHTVGPITRSVRDAAHVLGAIAGHDPRDPTSLTGPAINNLELKAGQGVEGLIIGITRGYFFDDTLPAVRKAVERSAEIFSELGAEIVEVDTSFFSDIPLALAAAQHESQSVLLPLALAHPDGFATPEIRYRILAGEFVSLADRRRGMQIRNEMRRRMNEILGRVDVVLSPCNSTVAFPIEAERVTVGGGTEVDLTLPGGQSRITTRLTLPWNLTGLPSISVPSGEFLDGMPIGIQLSARRLEEATLLATAAAYEERTGGYRPPPVRVPTTTRGAVDE